MKTVFVFEMEFQFKILTLDIANSEPIWLDYRFIARVVVRTRKSDLKGREQMSGTMGPD